MNVDSWHTDEGISIEILQDIVEHCSFVTLYMLGKLTFY